MDAVRPILIRAPFFHTPSSPFKFSRALVCEEDGALLISAGRIVASGPYADVSHTAKDVEVTDWRGGYIVPGLIDAHVHYPQLRIIGGLGRSLLDWLQHVALPEEARMAEPAYSVETAKRFVAALASHGTTTALVFGSHFPAATAALFEAAAESGMRIISGLVLSDRSLRPELHLRADEAYRESVGLIERFHGKNRLHYAVTPRFALSTSESMLEVSRTLTREYGDVRIQTHINEQPDEVEACVNAFPWAADYLAIYERYSLCGPRTVFAHNVQASDGELKRMAAAKASVAHCPCSNAALGSGIFPMRRHMTAGVHFALGTDVGGGIGFGMLKETLQAYLMQRVTSDGAPLTPAHLLYLATRAGAEALGLHDETGDFTPGRSADFVYVRPPAESPLASVLERADSMEQALAAIITMGGADSIREVRVSGERVSVARGSVPPVRELQRRTPTASSRN